MKKYLPVASVTLLFGTVLFGIIYPLFIWTVAHLFFPHKAEGSPILTKLGTIGFQEIGQQFSSSLYFWSRPGVGTRTISGGSNLSWSSETLQKRVHTRVDFLRKQNPGSFVIPHDLVMESASGFDPHISLKAALFQVKRVALARNIPEEELDQFVLQHTDLHLFGLFPDRVNVLLLNQELDRLNSTKTS